MQREQEMLNKGSKKFFQVIIDFPDDDTEERSCPEGTFVANVSEPIPTVEEADKVVSELAEEITIKYPSSKIEFVELKDMDDFYYIMVKDENGSCLAKLGVMETDYSGETIH